jgi:hypothetical protein
VQTRRPKILIASAGIGGLIAGGDRNLIAGKPVICVRHCEERERRSNPFLRWRNHGLLRFARNDRKHSQ